MALGGGDRAGISRLPGADPTPSGEFPQPVAAEQVRLYGAGATFPSFLYLRWFDEYRREHPQVSISYQPWAVRLEFSSLLLEPWILEPVKLP